MVGGARGEPGDPLLDGRRIARAGIGGRGPLPVGGGRAVLEQVAGRRAVRPDVPQNVAAVLVTSLGTRCRRRPSAKRRQRSAPGRASVPPGGTSDAASASELDTTRSGPPENASRGSPRPAWLSPQFGGATRPDPLSNSASCRARVLPCRCRDRVRRRQFIGAARALEEVAAGPPLSRSFPEAPLSVSLPPPAQTMSLPCRPRITSLPPRALDHITAGRPIGASIRPCRPGSPPRPRRWRRLRRPPPPPPAETVVVSVSVVGGARIVLAPIATEAELVSCPAFFGVTLMVTVAIPNREHAQLTGHVLPLMSQLPCEADADTNATWLGSSSVTTSPRSRSPARDWKR